MNDLMLSYRIDFKVFLNRENLVYSGLLGVSVLRNMLSEFSLFLSEL